MKRRGFLGALLGGPVAAAAAVKAAESAPVVAPAPVIEEVPLHTTSAAPAHWDCFTVSVGWGGVTSMGPIDRNPLPFWKNAGQ